MHIEKNKAGTGLIVPAYEKAAMVGAALPKSYPVESLCQAASRALPIPELEAQAFGSKTAWGTHTRPGRAAARVKAIRFLVRAACLAIDAAPDMPTADILAALSSFQLRTADCLIDPLSGQWLTNSKAAIRHRGEEMTRAIVEAARCIGESTTEGGLP